MSFFVQILYQYNITRRPQFRGPIIAPMIFDSVSFIFAMHDIVYIRATVWGVVVITSVHGKEKICFRSHGPAGQATSPQQKLAESAEFQQIVVPGSGGPQD